MSRRIERDIAASLWLARRLADLGARIHGHTFMPLPGTPYRDAPPARIAPEQIAVLDRLSSQSAAFTANSAARPGSQPEIAERRAAH